MMVAYVNRAVKSPCCDCPNMKLPEYPECADNCLQINEYRRYLGLPVARRLDPVAAAELNRECRSPVEYTQEALELIEFIESEKKRIGCTYPELSARIGVPVHRLQGIGARRYKRIRPDIAAKITDYRKTRESHE